MKKVIIFFAIFCFGLAAHADYTVQTYQQPYNPLFNPLNNNQTNTYTPQQTYTQTFYQNPALCQAQYATQGQYANPYRYNNPYWRRSWVNYGLNSGLPVYSNGNGSIARNIGQSMIYSLMNR